jgi:Trk K+ transport system NAD-binding subunit
MTAPKASLGARLRYRFDNALARGPVVVIAYMGLLVLALIVVAGVIALLFGLRFGDGNENLFEAMYQSLLRMLDPGTFSGDAKWPLRALTLVVTLIGVIIGGSLIGLIANAVDQRVEALNRGRGAVVESGHSLILGWSPAVPRIISELVIANESEKDAAIVVLARGEKTALEEMIEELVPDTKTTRVVVRNGDPSVPVDLQRACVDDARSIVIVRDEDGDAGVVKAILALRAIDEQFGGRHVIAEINASDNASTLRTVTGGRVLPVSSDRVVAEVTAQACLQPGLAGVFADLLDFDGDEMFFTVVPELSGRTYAEAQLSFEASSVIGRIGADGTVELNPTPDTVIAPDDQLILVASDDSAIAFTGTKTVPAPAPAAASAPTVGPIRALFVGWSGFGALVLEQLDEFLVPGSTILVQVDEDLVDVAALDALALANATIEVHAGRGGPEDVLGMRDLGPFDQVIVLAYRDSLDAGDADARTLLSLLALRMVWPQGNAEGVRIIAELVDQRNLDIASPVGIDDLIVSDALTSLLMAQLSERGELLAVFEDLFDPEGAVVALVPAPTLVPDQPLEFASVVAAASATRRSAFGYRLASTNTLVMNPSKSSRVTLGAGDEVLVIEHRSAAAPPVVTPSKARATRTQRKAR